MDPSIEIERKYAAPEGLPLPPLGDLPGVTAEGPPRAFELAATYFDTRDLRLAARNVRLRRRTGGTDEGWHVKIPSPDGVLEFHHPLGRGAKTVPVPLRGLVDAVSRGAALAPVARIETRRVERDLLGRDGQALAHVVEDDVTGHNLATDARSTWREIEVELANGGRDLLDVVERRLGEAGIIGSGTGSKLSTVLGDGVRLAWPADNGVPARSDRAGDVAAHYLRSQVEAILEHDPRVRRDEPDSVHKMRVATRRLRSALRIFRPLVERSVTDPVATELRWLGECLGAARDEEVQRDALLGQLSELPPEMVLGPVTARLQAEFTGGYARAHERLLVELSGSRYFALLDALDALVVEPPLTAQGREQTAAEGIPSLVRKAYRRLRREIEAGLDQAPSHERDEALHEARKSAKRLRYTCESVSATFGRQATRLAAAAESIQELLGEHQDCVVRRHRLRETALAAYARGENTFTYGLLSGVAQQRAADIEKELPAAWRRASRAKLRRWTR